MYRSSRAKKTEVELGGKKIMIKEGALHKALKTKKGHTFNRTELSRLNKNERLKRINYAFYRSV